MNRRLAALTGGAAALPLLLLVAANGADEAAGTAYQTLLPEVRHSFHLSLTQLGVAAVAAGPVALLVNLPLGWLGDRWRRTLISALGILVSGIASVLIGVAAWVPLLVVGIVFARLGSDGEVTHRSLLADWYPLAARTRVYATYDLGCLAVGALVPVLAGGGADLFGWRTVLVLLALPAAAVAWLVFRQPEPNRGVSDREGIGLRGELATSEEVPAGWTETFRVLGALPTARLVYPAIAFSAASSAGYTLLISTFYDDRYHLGPLGRGSRTALVAVAAGVGTLLMLTIGARRLQARGGRGFAVTLGVLEAISALANIPLVAFHVLAGSLASDALTVGADAAATTGVVVIASLIVPARMRTLGLATGSAWAVLGLIGAPIFGRLADHHGTPLALGLTAVPSLGEALLLLLTARVLDGDLHRSVDRQKVLAELRVEHAHGSDVVLSARGLVVEGPSGRRLDGVDLDVRPAELVALVGGNGAGKSTLLEALSGLLVPAAGVVTVGGVEISGDPGRALAFGVVHAPGAAALFDELTVREHLRIGGWSRGRRGGDVDGVLDLLPTLRDRLDVPAGELSGGERQLLNVAVALVVPSRVVLLDELALGLSEGGEQQADALVDALRRKGTAVVVVEQEVSRAVRRRARQVVLDGGRIVTGVRQQFLLNERQPPVAQPEAGASLAAVGLCHSYRGLVALEDVGLHVAAGEVVAITGPNGAGKSTLLDLLGGAQRPDTGTITLDGIDITRLPAHARAQRGLRRSLQGGRLWPDLVLSEALAVATRSDRPPNLLAAVTAAAEVSADERETRDRVAALLARFGLDRYRDRPVGQLSTGTRQVAALACLAAGRPRVALIDEPVAGVASHERAGIAALVRELAEVDGAAVVLVEHDLDVVRSVADRVVVLEAGRVAQVYGTLNVPAPASASTERKSAASSPHERALAAGGRTPPAS